MTKSQLIETVSEKLSDSFSNRDIELIVNTIFNDMSRALKDDGRIEIRGLGSFKTVQREPRIGRNPKTGERVEVPAKKAVCFKTGRELRERVDNVR